MIKKVTCLLVICLLTVTTCLPVFAADGDFQTLSGNQTSGTTLVTANTGDEASLKGTYQVQIPALIKLSISDNFMYEATYEVGAKGSIPQKKKLSITPASTFDMLVVNDSDQPTGGKDTATVEQQKTDWTRDGDTGTLKLIKTDWTNTSGKVSADLKYDGKYKGTLTFNYNLSAK